MRIFLSRIEPEICTKDRTGAAEESWQISLHSLEALDVWGEAGRLVLMSGRTTVKRRASIPVVLTIAGSDSGGGAGIQADLKIFLALDVFGTAAVTCLTAQNPNIVRRISGASPGMVGLQITTVCEGFRVSAAKTGMLYSAPIIKAVAKAVASAGIPVLVVDPVMIATSGARLLRKEAVKELCSRLLPMATVITPNVPEAEALCGHRITSVDELKSAAREIGERYGTSCVVKGGHLGGPRVVDALFDVSPPPGKGTERVYSLPRLKHARLHGSGCVFSAALTAFLARGETLSASVRLAKRFVQNVRKRGGRAGRYQALAFSP